MSEVQKTSQAGYALFDLDGTLLAWDCQVLFRHFILQREPWRVIFLLIFLLFLPLTSLLGAEGMKRVFLCFLWRMPAETLSEYSKEFAKSLRSLFYPELLAEVEAHRESGHFLILTSASPEFYVREIGKLLGFDLTLGTPVEMGGFFPDLTNHKGEAKVKRLLEILPTTDFSEGKLNRSHGYTDSTADLPMLGLCHGATVVNPSPRLAILAKKSGWKSVTPARPWKSRLHFYLQVAALVCGLGRSKGDC